jgi:hypothetical protein
MNNEQKFISMRGGHHIHEFLGLGMIRWLSVGGTMFFICFGSLKHTLGRRRKTRKEATGTNLIGCSTGKELVSDFALVGAGALDLNPVITPSTARTAQVGGDEHTML